MRNIILRTFFVFLTILFLSSCKDASIQNKTTLEKKAKINLTNQQIGNTGYNISIPDSYFIKITDGPDFSVYYIEPTDSTATNKLTAGLYFGNNPSLFELPTDSCETRNRRAIILGSEKDWTIFDCKDEYLIQTLIYNKDGEDWNQNIHAFGITKNEADLETVLEVFTTLKKN